MNEKNNFIFYPSYLECVENAPENERAETIYAIVQYGIYGKIPENAPQSFKMIFPAIKPNIDSSINNYNARVENGKKGGRPKKEKNLNETETKPNNNLDETETKPKRNLNKDKDKNKDKNKDIDIEEQQQKEINKETDFDVDDVDFEKKSFFYDCISEKLSKLYFADNFDYSRVQDLFSKIYEEDNFIIGKEKISCVVVLENLLKLFSGEQQEAVDRFNELLLLIDNAVNINNKFKYSVSVLYKRACEL